MTNRTLGIVLVLVGVLTFVGNLGWFEGELFLVLLGAGFIAAYFLAGKRVGFLIPGTILIAIGLFAGLDSRTTGQHGYLFFLFLAAAFLAVFIVDHLAGAGGATWALYPAAGLAAFSLFIFVLEGGHPYAEVIGDYWPVALILVGAWLLFGRGGLRRGTG